MPGVPSGSLEIDLVISSFAIGSETLLVVDKSIMNKRKIVFGSKTYNTSFVTGGR